MNEVQLLEWMNYDVVRFIFTLRTATSSPVAVNIIKLEQVNFTMIKVSQLFLKWQTV